MKGRIVFLSLFVFVLGMLRSPSASAEIGGLGARTAYSQSLAQYALAANEVFIRLELFRGRNPGNTDIRLRKLSQKIDEFQQVSGKLWFRWVELNYTPFAGNEGWDDNFKSLFLAAIQTRDEAILAAQTLKNLIVANGGGRGEYAEVSHAIRNLQAIELTPFGETFQTGPNFPVQPWSLRYGKYHPLRNIFQIQQMELLEHLILCTNALAMQLSLTRDPRFMFKADVLYNATLQATIMYNAYSNRAQSIFENAFLHFRRLLNFAMFSTVRDAQLGLLPPLGALQLQEIDVKAFQVLQAIYAVRVVNIFGVGNGTFDLEGAAFQNYFRRGIPFAGAFDGRALDPRNLALSQIFPDAVALEWQRQRDPRNPSPLNQLLPQSAQEIGFDANYQSERRQGHPIRNQVRQSNQEQRIQPEVGPQQEEGAPVGRQFEPELPDVQDTGTPSQGQTQNQTRSGLSNRLQQGRTRQQSQRQRQPIDSRQQMEQIWRQGGRIPRQQDQIQIQDRRQQGFRTQGQPDFSTRNPQGPVAPLARSPYRGTLGQPLVGGGVGLPGGLPPVPYRIGYGGGVPLQGGFGFGGGPGFGGFGFGGPGFGFGGFGGVGPVAPGVGFGDLGRQPGQGWGHIGARIFGGNGKRARQHPLNRMQYRLRN